jgi:two-component system, sensor histidine kinase
MPYAALLHEDNALDLQPATMDELREITQHLLRFSPDALIVIDDDNRIRFANDTVWGLFGHAPEALIGKSLEMLIPERLRAHHGKHTASFMLSPDNREMGARIADLFALRADGTEFAAGIRLAPFRISGRLFVAAAIRDTTERRLVNDELVAAREEADRANRAKSRFLATASHDLRQPMQTIRLLNAAMMKIVPQAEVRDLLQQQGAGDREHDAAAECAARHQPAGVRRHRAGVRRGLGGGGVRGAAL